MKKYFLIISFILTSFIGHSQIGITISPQLAWDKTKVIGLNFGSAGGTNFGSGIGISYRTGLSGNLALKPSLSFGAVFTDGTTSKAIGLGAAVAYYFEEDFEGFFVSLGPGFGYSLEGNYENLNEFGVSVGGAIGYSTGNVEIGAGFGVGLTNAVTGGGDIASVKGRSAGLSVGFFF